MAPFMLEADLNVQNPIIDIIMVCFKTDIRGNINKTVDIKGYRLWRVSNYPRRHWRHHCCKKRKATTKSY